MSEIEVVNDHGLEVLKKSATILDDSKKTVYSIRTLSTYAGSNLFQPTPDQYDTANLTYDANNNIETIKYYYSASLVRTVTLAWESYIVDGVTLYRVASAVYS